MGPVKPLSAPQHLQQDLWFLTNHLQKLEIENLQDSTQAANYLQQFWEGFPLPPGADREFVRRTYYQRLEYVRKVYGIPRGWGPASDRARVYVLYGPPDEVIRSPWNLIQFDNNSLTKSLEIWVYFRQAGTVPVPSLLQSFYPGQMKFVFTDQTGAGVHDQIFSTEEGEKIDPQLYWSDRRLN